MDYQKHLDNAYARYEVEVEHLAELAQQMVVLPYLKEHKLKMVVGNGTYVIYDPEDTGWNDDLMDKLPQDIQDVLQLEVAGSRGNPDLGCWMRDYP